MNRFKRLMTCRHCGATGTYCYCYNLRFLWVFVVMASIGHIGKALVS